MQSSKCECGTFRYDADLLKANMSEPLVTGDLTADENNKGLAHNRPRLHFQESDLRERQTACLIGTGEKVLPDGDRHRLPSWTMEG